MTPKEAKKDNLIVFRDGKTPKFGLHDLITNSWLLLKAQRRVFGVVLKTI